MRVRVPCISPAANVSVAASATLSVRETEETETEWRSESALWRVAEWRWQDGDEALCRSAWPLFDEMICPHVVVVAVDAPAAANRVSAVALAPAWTQSLARGSRPMGQDHRLPCHCYPYCNQHFWRESFEGGLVGAVVAAAAGTCDEQNAFCCRLRL